MLVEVACVRPRTDARRLAPEEASPAPMTAEPDQVVDAGLVHETDAVVAAGFPVAFIILSARGSTTAASTAGPWWRQSVPVPDAER